MWWNFIKILMVFILLTSCAQKSGEKPAPPWPEWAFHHWVWEDESTQESAIDLVDGYLSRDIPVGAIIIDSPWETGYNTFEFDAGLYPDAKTMIDYFHSKGVRVFLWITGVINTDVTELFNYARSKNYFMQKSADNTDCVVNWWKGDGCLIDFFNPEAVQWWHSLMDKALALDIDGWKADGTDFYALFVPYSPYLKANVNRLDYSHAYYRDLFEYTRQNLGTDRIITARPVDNYGSGMGGDLVAFAPVDINWSGWVGDQDATFEGMRKALNNMLWSSDYGYVAFGSDIGGYREKWTEDPVWGRTKELFIRWAQLGAFCPVMENGGGGEHRPWMFGEETLNIYRRFVKLHYEIISYLMEEGAVAFEKGESLMKFIYNTEDAYLLGPDILVFPMLESGTSRHLKFPQGSQWVYLFDRTRIFSGGDEQDMKIPLSEFPVFLRKGSDIEEKLVVE
jgi:alpha-glucosidase (family GH31 glycosyl hydrolase)